MVCRVTPPLPGVSVVEVGGQCAVTVDTTALAAGTYSVRVHQVDDVTGQLTYQEDLTINVPDLGASTQVYYQITPLDECTADLTCFVDEDGIPFPTQSGTDGTCVVIPRTVSGTLCIVDENGVEYGTSTVNGETCIVIPQTGAGGVACIVDETGTPYATSTVNGETCTVIPQPVPYTHPTPVVYTTAAGIGSVAGSCASDADTGRSAYNSTDGAVTHICGGASLGWMPLCGCDDDPVECSLVLVSVTDTTPDPSPVCSITIDSIVDTTVPTDPVCSITVSIVDTTVPTDPDCSITVSIVDTTTSTDPDCSITVDSIVDTTTTDPPGSLGDATVAVADQGTETIQWCTDCGPANWEIRVDDPADQFNSPTPDPNNPPGSAWQPVPDAAGLECVELAIQELWDDGQDPDASRTTPEELFLHIRAVCISDGSTQEATLTITL